VSLLIEAKQVDAEETLDKLTVLLKDLNS